MRGGCRTSGSQGGTTTSDRFGGGTMTVSDTHDDQLAPEDRPPLDLLVWDAPNIDMTLANVIGARPSASSRPRFDAVARWLLAASDDREVEGCVFANVPPGAA